MNDAHWLVHHVFMCSAQHLLMRTYIECLSLVYMRQ